MDFAQPRVGEPLEPAPAAPVAGGAPQPVRDLVRAARPSQWTKNVLVLVAPGAAGALVRLHPALVTLGTFGVFCAAASACYLLNDTIDAVADRAHPAKRERPIAAGRVGPVRALTTAAVLLAIALGGAAALAGWQLTTVVATYAALTSAYSLGLKRQPVIELTVVASGFVLRAIAGGVATHVDLSQWFLVVTSFTALFIVVGKRTAEHETLGDQRGTHRHALSLYSRQFLRSALTLSASGAVTTYCLWAFDKTGLARRGDHLVFIELSVAPVIAGVLYILRLLDAGHGGAPSQLALQDRTLQLLALAWAVLVGIGVYA